MVQDEVIEVAGDKSRGDLKPRKLRFYCNNGKSVQER